VSDRGKHSENRPILFVDVDGVISLFGFEELPEGTSARFEMIDGMVRCISVPAGERLRRLADHFELVWVTGWGRRANLLAPLLGLPELPYVGFRGKARFGSADWKLGPLGKYAAGRPLAWLDDSFEERCYAWAAAREEPTLLISTESHRGIEDEHVEALTAWSKSLVGDLE
jgi:hypothetical protein